MALLMLLVLFLPNTYPEDYYTQMNLPEGAIARIGKGGIDEILYSPDGTRLAVRSWIGVWLYDTTTNREVALFPGATSWSHGVAFSPDGETLTSWGTDKLVYLWNAKTGEPKGTLTGHTKMVLSVVFSPDGKTLASGE